MTRIHIAFMVAAIVSIAVAVAALVVAFGHSSGPGTVAAPRVVAVLPGASLTGQCSVTPTSGLITMPGNRLGCGLNVDVPVLWPVVWGQFSGQLGAQPGSLSVGATTGVSVGLPGLPTLGGGR